MMCEVRQVPAGAVESMHMHMHILSFSLVVAMGESAFLLLGRSGIRSDSSRKVQVQPSGASPLRLRHLTIFLKQSLFSHSQFQITIVALLLCSHFCLIAFICNLLDFISVFLQYFNFTPKSYAQGILTCRDCFLSCCRALLGCLGSQQFEG